MAILEGFSGSSNRKSHILFVPFVAPKSFDYEHLWELKGERERHYYKQPWKPKQERELDRGWELAGAQLWQLPALALGELEREVRRELVRELAQKLVRELRQEVLDGSLSSLVWEFVPGQASVRMRVEVWVLERVQAWEQVWVLVWVQTWVQVQVQVQVQQLVSELSEQVSEHMQGEMHQLMDSLREFHVNLNTNDHSQVTQFDHQHNHPRVESDHDNDHAPDDAQDSVVDQHNHPHTESDHNNDHAPDDFDDAQDSVIMFSNNSGVVVSGGQFNNISGDQINTASTSVSHSYVLGFPQSIPTFHFNDNMDRGNVMRTLEHTLMWISQRLLQMGSNLDVSQLSQLALLLVYYSFQPQITQFIEGVLPSQRQPLLLPLDT